MFLANFIPAANYTTPTAGNLSADEARIRQVEARAVGIHVGDDMGMWTHYSQAQKNWAFAYGTDKGVSRIQPNIPAAEWIDLNKVGGLFRMYDKADLGFIQEYGRRVAYKVGEFGKALGDNVVDWIKRWNLEDAYNNDASVAHWGGGAPAHHNTAQIGSLYNSFYNRDPMNHSWTNWTGGGLPVAVMANIVEQTMKPWYGPGMGAAVDNYVAAAGPYVGMNHAKAVVAKFVLNRTELHNDLGICDWSYPWWASPLKERGLLGDLSVEAKLYSAATGETKTMPELDLDSERASTLHRALIVRRYGSMQIRAEHDQLPPWAAADLKAEWNTILDQWYEELGYDKATGTPTRATYHRLGMDDVADELLSLGLLEA
jgi:aldehyde:ferredoxin oxidoreductase